MLKKFDIIYNNLLSSQFQLLMVKFNVLKLDKNVEVRFIAQILSNNASVKKNSLNDCFLTEQINCYGDRNDLNFLSNSAFSIVEVYDTACLARNNGSFLTLLSADRSGLPESMNLDIQNFKEINKDLSKVVFDFSRTITWDSKIQQLKLADQDRQPTINVVARSENNEAIPMRLPRLRLAMTLHVSCQRWLDLKFLNIKHNRFVLKKINKINNIAELIGLGEGLTPSGDDFIVGALNMAACFSTRLFVELKEKILPVRNKTSPISRHYINLALQKRSSEDIIGFLSALGKGKINETTLFTKRILNTGATSGYYTIKGMLWALKKI